MTEIATAKGIVTTRPALPGDAAAVIELRLESLQRHPEVFAADYASTAAEPVQNWADRIVKYAGDKTGVIYLALAGNQLIGMTGLYCGNHLKTRHNGNLWGVYVKAEWRGFQVADALINNCVDWGQAHGLVMIKLAVITTNIAAIRCYSRCGFVTYGVDSRVIHCNGVFYDELMMAREV